MSYPQTLVVWACMATAVVVYISLYSNSRSTMEPHNPENARHGPGSGAKQRRSATTLWLIVANIALTAAVSATLISYR
jgi:hypothetical protein